MIGAYRGPLGFVGGEVYAHQRGFIGVLGILGLWCHAHRNHIPDDTVDHLVVVADCCFAGIWGSTLESIAKSEVPDLQKYRELLYTHPVSIQCATSEFEASHSGVFTPLWYFLNTGKDLPNYQQAFLREREPVPGDESDTQHPFYVSTSMWRPSWKCFDDPAFFRYLHSKQLQKLECDRQHEDVRKDNCSPLVRPYIIALDGEAASLRETLQSKLRTVQILHRYPVAFQELLQSAEEAIKTIKQSLAGLSNLLFSAIPRSQRTLQHYVLDRENRLSEANYEQLKNQLQVRARDERAIPPGVYVFQGGEGDMSLIVAPDQKRSF